MNQAEPQSAKLLAGSLSRGAQLFVFSIRQWVSAATGKQCVHAALGPFYERYNASSALLVLDELMCQLSATAVRGLHINCPCRSDLGEDEKLLLQILQHLERGDHRAAVPLLDSFFGGPSQATFIRVVKAYIAELKSADLSLNGAGLTLVTKVAE